jgi:hypothetical protein
MPLQIPAGLRSRLRKQSVHASLRGWRLEDELCLPILLRNRVIVTDNYRTIRIPSFRQADPKYYKIHPVGQNCHAYCAHDSPQQYATHPAPKIVNCERRHEARL